MQPGSKPKPCRIGLGAFWKSLPAHPKSIWKKIYSKASRQGPAFRSQAPRPSLIDECIEINPEGKISTRGDESINIDKKYRTWVQTQDGIKVERSVLIEYMNNHFKEYTVTKDSKNKSWKGIAIKSDEEEAIPEFIDNDEN